MLIEKQNIKWYMPYDSNCVELMQVYNVKQKYAKQSCVRVVNYG